jgi:dTDP-glucose 4,6-dehydratase/UDP-glucose 4-epimerase
MCQEIEGSNYQMIPFPDERKAIDVGDFICDYSTFRNQFKWEPKVSFEEGIQRSFEYFKDEFEHYF